jgi:DsbC/DsbD-like thiol-disulfide interchange protein
MEPRMKSVRVPRRHVVLGGFAALFLPNTAAALERHYRLRLICGEPLDDGMLRAGVDIILDHGWKTYWRMPGDAGVPPQFDWSASANVKSVEVLWPAPARIIDAGGETVGYKDQVVFPLRVAPLRAAESVTLELTMFLGVCKDICIPVDEHAALASWQAEPAAETLLLSFERRVPAKAGKSSPFRVARAWADAGSSNLELRLAFTESLPDNFDIFVESRDTSYFRAPRRSGPDSCVIAVEGVADPRRLKGAELKLTIVARNLALEQDVIVD